MEVKQYLPISTKKVICEQIVKNSIIEQNGMKFIDYCSQKLAIDISLIQFYTDINIEEIDMDEFYESGKMEEIRKAIPESEYSFIVNNVKQMLKQEIEIYNSLSAVINRNLEKVINNLPTEKEINKILNKLPKVLDKISPENKEILKGVIEGKMK